MDARFRTKPLDGLSRRVPVVLIWGVLVFAGTLATAGSELSAPTSVPGPSGSAVAVQTEAPTAEPAPATQSAMPAASEPVEQAEAVTLNDNAGGAGGNNIVLVSNRNDESFRMRGAIQVNRINAPNVAPQNLAIAQGINCTGCETYAVAMQINLIGPDTNRVVPANAAVAVNAACASCVTAAEAFQYILTVDDPMEMPPEARQLVRVMEAELREISSESETVVEALGRVDAVEVRFKALADSLDQELDVATTDPSGAVEQTPTPSATVSPTPTATPETPAATPSVTPSPSATVEPTPVPQPSP